MGYTCYLLLTTFKQTDLKGYPLPSRDLLGSGLWLPLIQEPALVVSRQLAYCTESPAFLRLGWYTHPHLHPRARRSKSTRLTVKVPPSQAEPHLTTPCLPPTLGTDLAGLDRTGQAVSDACAQQGQRPCVVKTSTAGYLVIVIRLQPMTSPEGCNAANMLSHRQGKDDLPLARRIPLMESESPHSTSMLKFQISVLGWQ